MTIVDRRRRTPLIALLAADGSSRVGNAVTVVAVPLLALQIAGTPWAVAAAGVAATMPIVIGGALGGALVDRVGFRRASIVADAASGATVLAVPTLGATGLLPLWALLLLVFASNLLDAPGNAARRSQIPELCALAGVSLARAAAAQATVSRTASLVGASVAGLLVAVVGADAALYATACSFAIALALTITLVPRLELETGPDTDTADGFAGLIAGFRFIARTPLVLAVVMMVLLTNAIDTAGFTVLKPLYATSTGDGSALGLMIACSAGGALIGAAMYGIIGDRLPRHPLYVALFVIAGVIPSIALAVAPPLPVLLVVLFTCGLAMGPLNPLIDSALFRLIPAAIRARVLSAISAGVAAGMPVGSLVAGAAVTAIGLQPTLAATAAVYIAVILATGFGKRWRDF